MSEVMPETWRAGVARNHYQGAYRRVLCVCSGGILRSPTLAWVLSNPPYNCNTRAVGSHKEYALVPIDQILIDWANVVIFVNEENFDKAKESFDLPADAIVLSVPDSYAYRDSELVAAIRAALERIGFPTADKVLC